MLTESNKIVLVDDDENELKRLSHVFYDKGIGCRSLKYDSFYDAPLSNVHILFMDINLSNANEGDDKKRNTTLKDALNLYIAKDNGPYVLVFWTSNVEWKDSFLEFIKRDEDNLPVSPCYITTMAKEEFSVEKIEAIFNESPVRILFEYEEEMSKSISDATTRILNTIPIDKVWGETKVFDANCKNVFASIAAQNAGYELAKQNPDRAIKEALIPLYAHTFLSSKSNLWGNALKGIFDQKKSFPSNYNLAQLNSIFLIDSNKNNLLKEYRGCVCKIKDSKRLIKSFYSEKGYESVDDWYFDTLPLKDKSDLGYAKMVCIEMSAACDYSQKRNRTYKYLLGLMIPEEKNGKLCKKLKESTILFDFPLEINGRNMIFCFDFNYSFTISRKKRNIIANPICQFKKELMDWIGNEYANHISRIGITSFR